MHYNIYFRAVVASIPMGVGFHLLNCVAGLVIYAHYAKCDPMTAPNKPISSADQVRLYWHCKNRYFDYYQVD